MFRRFRAVSAALGAGLVLGLACQHTETRDRERDDLDAAPPTDGGREAGFGASACYACFSAACSTPIGACNGEPGCAGYLACLGACPTGQNGRAEAACAAGCPPAS